MAYRLIPTGKIKGLTANQAYTYFCLLAKADYNTYVSRVKYQTLSELTGIKKDENLKSHLDTFIEKGLVMTKVNQYHKGNKGIFDTCTYYLYKPQTDWIRINTDLLSLEIPSKLKGFLILLKCICLNNTNRIFYNRSQISKTLNISRPTLNGYIKECTSLNLLKEEKEGFTIVDNHLFVVDAVKSKEQWFYTPVYEYLKSNGIIPPVYEEKPVLKIMFHFNSPQNVIVALKKRTIPTGTVCSWNYLAKVLSCNITDKPIERAKIDWNIIL